MTLNLQNAGRQRLGLTLPQNVARQDVGAVSIDGDPVTWQLVPTEAAGRLTVDLPAGRKFPRVVIEWTVAGQPLGIIGSLAPPLLEPDLPVLARSWTAWLPPGYDSLGSAAQGTSPNDSELSWSCRLFGPLGRAEGASRFDPLSANDWTTPALWASDGPMQSPAPDMQGWTAWRMDLPAAAPAAMQFVHGASMRLLGVIVLLLTAAAGCWKAARRPVLLASLLGGFGVAAMLAPEAYAPIASGGVLGALFCLAWRWLHTQVSSPATETTVVMKAPAVKPGPGSTVSKAVRITLLLGVVLQALSVDRVVRGEPAGACREAGGEAGRRVADVPRADAHR